MNKGASGSVKSLYTLLDQIPFSFRKVLLSIICTALKRRSPSPGYGVHVLDAVQKQRSFPFFVFQ